MDNFIHKAGLSVAEPLVRFIEDLALPKTGITAETLWVGMAKIFSTFATENHVLLEKRVALQAEIDAWHKSRRGQPHDAKTYQDFLRRIGYITPEPSPFKIGVENVDDELAIIAGPQLVVPISNARFLLNAANARWGSLYDALYGTDAIIAAPAGRGYDPKRGAAVIAWAKDFLDRSVPLASSRHADVAAYAIKDGQLWPALADTSALAGYRGDAAAPSAILLRHHGLHIELVIDRVHAIGKNDKAGVADVILEAAVTTIADLEDSIAAVDAEDKVAAYANWLGLMRGTLEATFEKAGHSLTRKLSPDRNFTTPAGGTLTLPGRSLMLIRNVGHLMTTPAIKLQDGQDAPEGILDAIVTSLIGLHDLSRTGRLVNSRTGSIYIVKPKMHGAEEAGFTNRVFDAVEDLLGLSASQHQSRRDGRGAPYIGKSRGHHCGGPRSHRIHQHRISGSYGGRDPHFDAGRRDGAQGRDEATASG